MTWLIAQTWILLVLAFVVGSAVAWLTARTAQALMVPGRSRRVR